MKSSSAIPEDEEEEEEEVVLDKRFGFSKEFTSRLEVGVEVGRGHFGYTCSATFKKGEHKGHQVAVKVIPKSKVQLQVHLSFSFSFSFYFIILLFYFIFKLKVKTLHLNPPTSNPIVAFEKIKRSMSCPQFVF